MAIGIIGEPKPYILDRDRDVAQDLQTVFWIKPRSAKEANVTFAKFAGAREVGRGGREKYNSDALSKADREAFLSIIEKIENFFFAIPSPDNVHEKYLVDGKKMTIGTVECIKVTTIDTVEGLSDVWRCLSVQDSIELLEVSNDFSRLTDNLKKV